MKRETIVIGARPLVVEVGKWAMQTDASVVITSGDAVILVTVVSAPEPKPGLGFFPLTVDYREKAAAGGRIPGAYGKREGRPSTHETLSSRVIDRSLRPLFPKDYKHETQILCNVFSADPEVDHATLAITGASLALSLSDVPWEGPVAGVRVGRVDDELVAFPSQAQLEQSDMDFVVTVGPMGVLMVEGESEEVSEADLVACLAFASDVTRDARRMQSDWQKRFGNDKREWDRETIPEGVMEALEPHRDAIAQALLNPVKKARQDGLRAAKKNALDTIEDPDFAAAVKKQLKGFINAVGRDLILDGKRFDGRDLTQVRHVSCDARVLPSNHGSAVFTRGETQALASCTLAGPYDELRYDGLFERQTEQFFLHYNFPPYSVGETRPIRTPGRREVGHGMLAQRALESVIPDQNTFPYVIRIVSDILSSNGSSSMATVCAGCLAMLDAGVPLNASVAGVAMGLVKEGDRVAVLTDILGDEDHLGDMDFKVCGTRDGVTALQMDLKVEGLTDDILSRALEQARKARMTILDAMDRELAGPRADVATHAPKVRTFTVRSSQIGALIGPGGRNLRHLREVYGVDVEIDDDSGRVRLSSTDAKNLDEAYKRITYRLQDPVKGQTYGATILRVAPNYAIVELFPGTDGFLHVSEVAEGHVNIFDVLQPGERTIVKVLGVSNKGRIDVSRRAAMKST